MPSFKAYIVSWIVWWRFKSAWQSAENFRASIDRDRKAAVANPPGPPRHLYRDFTVERSTRPGFISDYDVYTVTPKSGAPTRARILYCHGGGFVFAIKPSHWDAVAQLARRLNAVVTVPLYPLGPETPLMKMYDVLQPLHDDLAGADDPTPFYVMGDSAGGTITLVLTQQARLANRPVAQRIVSITPCTDSSLTNPDAHAVAINDPWLGIEGVREVPRLICPEMDTKHPRVSPLYGDLSNLPPMLVFAAELDLLGPDTIKMEKMAREKGSKTELVIGEGMVHVWPILPIHEGQQAMDKIVEFLKPGN